MRGQGAIDRGIAALAGAQHGMLSRTQLRVLGLSDDAIDRRVACARLHVVHRGVYAVGHRVLTVEARWMAAVLAAGADAVLSHGSAAAAWELRRAGAGAIHVTVPGHGGRKSRAGVHLHRSATLDPEDITTHRAIPITTPARTIIDLATLLNGRPLEQALDRAEQLGLIDFADLANRLQAHPTRPGSPSYKRCCPATRRAPHRSAANSRGASWRSATTTASEGRTSTPASKEKKSTSSGGTRG